MTIEPAMSVPASEPPTATSGQPPTVAESLAIDDLVLDRALAEDDLDRFERQAIATRLADLISVAEPPLNIGLFGPWGSGKSSMEALIRRALDRRQESPGAARVKLIHYDAWKYGGHSLRRNFISNAATALGFRTGDPAADAFHRGLYETRRRALVDSSQLGEALVKIIPRFLAIYFVFVVLFALVVGAASVLTGEDFIGEIKRTLPNALAGSGVIALLLAVLKTVFDTGRVEIEQAQPSEEEEFTQTFRQLIDRVRPPEAAPPAEAKGWKRRADQMVAGLRWSWRWLEDAAQRRWLGLAVEEQRKRKEEARVEYDRLVFFIDELDRCDEQDVVDTLVAIRTFLDEKHCVFIVAADRAVLEHALERNVDQATPIVEEAPYYSSAGAFIDKVFQHQVTLPPLRSRRLTAFARDLVIRKETGLWAELRSQRLVNVVLPVLIPYQVRSPRRVKVLLNNFATNARIAQARGVEWPARAAELAKLTALQTEFPDFATALVSEPRLPRLLLDPDEASSDKARHLVARFRSDEIDTYLPDRERAGQKDEEDRWARMSEEHRQQLLRYLQVVSDSPDPRSDLLYLEAPGELFGLVDPELGELIEHDAPDFPLRVLGEIEQQPAVTQGQAVRLLADLVPKTIGKERRNVMQVILPTADRLFGDRVEDEVWRAAAGAVRVYIAEDELEAQSLVSILKIGLASRSSDLVATVFGNEDLLADDDRIINVGRLLDQIHAVQRSAVAEAIADRCPENPEVLLTPFNELAEEAALELYQDEWIQRAVAATIEAGGDAATAVVTGLLDAVLRTDERHD